MKATLNNDPSRRIFNVSYSMSEHELAASVGPIWERVLNYVAQEIAREIIKQHQVEILAKVDPVAIANLAIANAGQEIASAITRRPEVTHKVYNYNHRSIF